MRNCSAQREGSAAEADLLASPGLPALERLIGGFRRGRLYALCAAENASAMPLAVTLAHRLAVGREVAVAIICAAALHEWLLREIAWEDVEVASPFHYRGARTADEERQLSARREANRARPLHLLSSEEVSSETLGGALRALPQQPRLVIVDGESRRLDLAPVALRRLASVLDLPVLLLCSLEPVADEGPLLPAVPREVAGSADVLLAVGNPWFAEEQEDDAVPDHFFTPISLLGEQPPPKALLRFDLATHRFAKEA